MVNGLSICRVVGRLLSAVLVLLGFSSCNPSENGGECMYGTPHADFKIKGAITSEDGNPINKAEIIMKHPGVNYPLVDPLYADEDGVYGAEYSNWFDYKVRIVCKDPTGTYKSDSTDIVLEFKGKRDTWYIGKAEAEVNFKLKKKEEAE